MIHEWVCANMHVCNVDPIEHFIDRIMFSVVATDQAKGIGSQLRTTMRYSYDYSKTDTEPNSIQKYLFLAR